MVSADSGGYYLRSIRIFPSKSFMIYFCCCFLFSSLPTVQLNWKYPIDSPREPALLNKIDQPMQLQADEPGLHVPLPVQLLNLCASSQPQNHNQKSCRSWFYNGSPFAKIGLHLWKSFLSLLLHPIQLLLQNESPARPCTRPAMQI